MLRALLFAALIDVSAVAPPQAPLDRIELRDGAYLRGQIQEVRKGEYVKIVAHPTGETKTIPWSAIARIERAPEPEPEPEPEAEPDAGGLVAEPPPDGEPDATQPQGEPPTDEPPSTDAPPADASAAEATPSAATAPAPQPSPQPAVEPPPGRAVDPYEGPDGVDRTSIDADDDEAPYNRNGFLVSFGVGAASCAAPICSDIAAAGGARMDIGYRRRFIAFFASWFAAGGPISADDFSDIGDSDLEGSLVFVDAGAGIHVFPVQTGRVDPYVGVMLGYSRVQEKVRFEGEESELRFSRGVVRPTVGFDVYVHRIVALGPRFDIGLPFAGDVCADDPGTGEQQCQSIADAIDDSTEAAADRRLFRRTLPKPWSLMLQIRFTI